MVEIYSQMIQETLNPVSGGFFYDLMRNLSEAVPVWVPVGGEREIQLILESRIKSLFQYGELTQMIPPGTSYCLNYSLKDRELDFKIEFPPWYERSVSYHEPWSPREEYRRLWKLAEEGEVDAFRELIGLFRRNNDFNGALYLFQLAHHTLLGWPKNKMAYEIYEFAHGARWERYEEVLYNMRYTRESWPDPFC